MKPTLSKEETYTLAVYLVKKSALEGAWVAQLVKRLPSAQVMILESLDRVPHRAPCLAGSLLLPLTLPPLMCSLSQINK